MAESKNNNEVTENDANLDERSGGSQDDRNDQADDESDDVFSRSDKSKRDHGNHHKKERSASERDRKARSREKRQTRHSSQRSYESTHSDVDSVTKTELIRASAKRAQMERQRKSSSDNDRMDAKHKRLTPSGSVRGTEWSGVSKKGGNLNGRKQSASVNERRTSPRSSQRNGSASPTGRTSPKRSLSASPKHLGHSGNTSKTSLLSKPTASMNSSPMRSYSDSQQAAAMAALLPRPAARSQSYSKPAMEVAVAALVFAGGLVTLIVSLIIGSSAWTIVGAIAMGIGGVFIAFGACFYISRHKPLLGTEELLEIRYADAKQLAELSSEGFRVEL